jgi:hypothetical protein
MKTKKNSRTQYIEKGLPVLIALVAIICTVTPAKLFAVALDGGSDPRIKDYPADSLPKDIVATSSAATVSVTSQYATNGSSAQGRRIVTQQITGTMSYAWNRGLGGLFPSSDTNISGWVQGLGNPNVSIGYDFGIYDAASPTTLIPENSTVQSGKQVILKFNPYVSDNIFWFGTGYSLDSPFGEWRANAAPPARVNNKVICDSKDLTGQYTTSITGNYTFDVYIPLVVDPATRSLGQLNGLTCGAASTNPDGSVTAACTVTGTGTISPTFNYGSTFGRFYYRYYDLRDMTSIGWGTAGCYGNNIPLSLTSSISNPYTLAVAQQSFAYPLTVGPASNTAPNTPSLTCPSGNVPPGQDVSVTVSATDPDSDQVRYGVDWLNTGSVNSGWTAYVPSGTAQTLTKTGGYSSVGTYTITAWTQDSNGAQSAPASCQVNVSTSPDLTTGGVTPTTATAGTPTTLSATNTNNSSASAAAFPTLFQVQETGALVESSYNSGIAANGTAPSSISYTFPSAGTYNVRACSNNNSSWVNIITESNYANNCGPLTVITVTAAASTYSCTVSATTIPVNGSVTYTASIGGGALQNYTWQPSDNVGSYGSAATANRTFGTAGQYGMSVTRPTGFSAVGSAVCPVVTVGSSCSGTSTGTVTATPNRVRSNVATPVTFTLSAIQNVQTSCILSGPGVSQTFTASSCTVPGASTNQTITLANQGIYTLTCDGVKTSSVIVNILPNFTEF